MRTTASSRSTDAEQNVVFLPFTAATAAQVEEARLTGAAVAFGHVGETRTLAGDLRTAGLSADGAQRRAGAR